LKFMKFGAFVISNDSDDFLLPLMLACRLM
jgi:hypothetical protein